MTAELSKPFFVSLGPRGVVRVGGPDRHAFLQAIVSNDIALLRTQKTVYSCLLSPQGKFLHDFFVAEEAETLVLDCEAGSRAADLLAKLRPYKLRSKVELTLEEDRLLYAVFGARDEAPADPRSAALGRRLFSRPENLDERPRVAWDEPRIHRGLPDGSRDMDIGKDTLLDCNIDRAHGLSHGKGCYVGQEITARMNLRGLVKKRLRPVGGATLPPPFTDIVVNGQLAGQMRGASSRIGLALLKDDMLEALRGADGPLTLLEETV